MSSDEYEKLAARLSAVERKLVVIEANSRKACSEQPLVGPPDKSEERPAALARPQTIAEACMRLLARERSGDATKNE